MEYHDLKWLQKNYPEAYDSLPAPYQEDSCLVFFLDCNGNLCATGKPGDHLSNYEWTWDGSWWMI